MSLPTPFGSVRLNGISQAIARRDPNQARVNLLIQRIRAMAKNYPLRLFFKAEASKLAITVSMRQREARPA